ncbi:MAG TPA: ATP-binding cassette domain-containing protein, partial [Pseudomonadales bacterium]|nr:ATP-binding cassette domain-containing protein [Pseudomonadales bacterium]
MSLIRLRDICLSFGGPALLDHLSLTLEPNERVCLVGRNGSGKSTLLQVLNGEIKADDGKIERNGAVKLARLQQDVPQNFSGSVFDLVALGLGEAAPLLQRYEALLEQIAESSSDELLKELEILQKELENCGGWALEQQVKQVLSRLNLDGSLRFESLSGGLKRRVLLAQALVNEP